VVRIFPNREACLRLVTALAVAHDEDFAQLFEVRGRPAIAPWRSALVTAMQFAKGFPIGSRSHPCPRKLEVCSGLRTGRPWLRLLRALGVPQT
jgi:hypothetical protein